jgi:aspartate kinase
MQSTSDAVNANVGRYLYQDDSQKIALTQGFIGGSINQQVTTLGREGSDYSAALFGWVLDAKEVTIWKDVPGVMSADPGMFEDVVKLKELDYKEALELAYFGAKVIHPKTIRPLQNKSIPLRVRSFYDREDPGTLIHKDATYDVAASSVIVRQDQFLISIHPPDVSILTPDHFSRIFRLLHKYACQVNMIQNSASSFSVCMDDPGRKKETLLKSLLELFRVRYNENLELITIRNFDDVTIKKYVGEKPVLMEERNRTTVQFVIRPDR